MRVENGSTAIGPGFVDGADITFRARYDDFVDVFAGRSEARRAMLRGKLRPHGSPKAIWAARKLFG
jgi:putative sterol carrier protein